MSSWQQPASIEVVSLKIEETDQSGTDWPQTQFHPGKDCVSGETHHWLFESVQWNWLIVQNVGWNREKTNWSALKLVCLS